MSNCECEDKTRMRITNEPLNDGLYMVRCAICGGKLGIADISELRQ